MSRFRTIAMYFALAVATLAILLGISRIEHRLDRQVAEENLRFTGQIKNAPPLVAFTTVALGSFRGLVADLLWLRNGALQDKGNYFEMVQLARWITDLQPTFSGATAYLAWNMAYNISVTCSGFPDRWRWVSEGIKLIRDKALDYNPEDPILYKELAWIFQHKLGNIMDDANLYYKNQLAMQMTSLVGMDPDWKAMLAAPADEKAFLAAYPPEHRFWKAAQACELKDYGAVYEAFKAQSPGALPAGIRSRLGDDEKLLENLTNHFRRRYLYEVLRLDVAVIDEINEKYGMMDWRVPESQAIYWATMGIKRTPSHVDLNCERVITQSIYEAFRAGRLLLLDEKNSGTVLVVPNLALVDSVYSTFMDAQKTFEKSNSFSTFRSARINFMKEAISILYNYGKFSKAEEYYGLLRKEEPGSHRQPLETFVMNQWLEEVKDAAVKKASEVISGVIFRSVTYLVYNDQDAAVANERIARYIYNRYKADLGRDDRTKLPPYDDMKKAVVEQCLKSFQPEMAAILRGKIAQEQAEVAEERQRQQEGSPPGSAEEKPAPAAQPAQKK